MKKNSIIKVLGIFISILILIPMFSVSCDNDENGNVDPLIGKYTFSSAVFNETVGIKVEGYYVSFQPGDDASLFVRNGILKAAPCDNIANAAVDLRSDGKTYYICLGEDNEDQMGTWVNVGDSVLTFNISNPQSLALIISGLEITETQFKGTVENFPLPRDTEYELGADFPGGKNIALKSVDVTFARVE